MAICGNVQLTRMYLPDAGAETARNPEEKRHRDLAVASKGVISVAMWPATGSRSWRAQAMPKATRPRGRGQTNEGHGLHGLTWCDTVIDVMARYSKRAFLKSHGGLITSCWTIPIAWEMLIYGMFREPV